MAANYDNSAWFYDRLAQLVYGRSLLNAQVWLLQHIPAHSTVLIAGGGTGWILEELARIYPSGLFITYVEVSTRMTARAKKRTAGNNVVTFINDAVENTNTGNLVDVVITPFLFDNFTEQTMLKVFNHIHQLLKPGGAWLNADFQLAGKWWQHFLLRSMVLFFKVVCNIESWRLPDIEGAFRRSPYKLVEEKTFYSRFVIARVYQRE